MRSVKQVQTPAVGSAAPAHACQACKQQQSTIVERARLYQPKSVSRRACSLLGIAAASSAALLHPDCAAAQPPEGAKQFTTLDSGLKVLDIREGSGSAPQSGDKVCGTLQFRSTRECVAAMCGTHMSALCDVT